jgi:signal transduction histidine kinase
VGGLAAVLVGAALVLSFLDALPAWLAGEARDVRRARTVDEAERRLRARLVVPSYFPDTLAWPPRAVRFTLGVPGAAALHVDGRDGRPRALIAETVTPGEIPERLVPPAAPLERARRRDRHAGRGPGMARAAGGTARARPGDGRRPRGDPGARRGGRRRDLERARLGAGRAEHPPPLARLHRRALADGTQRAGGAVMERLPRPLPARAGTPRAGRQGIRFRVYLLVGLGVLVPAALVAAVSWARLRELDDELVGARRRAAVAVAEHLDEELTASLEVLQRLASAPQLGEGGDLEAARAVLRSSWLHSQFVGGVFLLDAEGRALAEEPSRSRSAVPPPDLAEIQATLRDAKPRLAVLVGAADVPRVYALVAVTDWRGRPVRVVGGSLDPSLPYQSRVLRHLKRGPASYADLVDVNGVVLASTDRARLHRKGACAGRVASLVRGAQPVVGACRVCHPGASPAVMAFAPLAAAPWGVEVVLPEAEVLATAGGPPSTFLLYGLGLVAVAAFFAWGAARSVTRPIAVLTASAESIASGRIHDAVPELGNDELGRLGRSVERMRTSLRDLIAFETSANELLDRRVRERTRELEQAASALREREGQRARMLQMVITAQEDERKRVARELHDETTQDLAVLVMGLETASTALKFGGPSPRLDEVKALAVRTLEGVHRLILDLRPSVLDDLGLFSAIRWYAERQLGERGVAVRCEIHELDHRLPSEAEIALFRICQEAMNNIARHAKAESVLIQLGADAGELVIEIEDDGQGFDLARGPQDARPHYGILGIRERAELLGGCAKVDSAPGKGTRVEVRVPLPAHDGPPLPAAAVSR